MIAPGRCGTIERHEEGGPIPSEYFGGVVTSVTWAIFQGGLLLTLHDFSSMLMAIGWALAMTSYVVLLYRGARS